MKLFRVRMGIVIAGIFMTDIFRTDIFMADHRAGHVRNRIREVEQWETRQGIRK